MRKLPIYTEAALLEWTTTSRLFADQTQRGFGVVSCRVGCDNCCHHPIYISVLEGIQIASDLMDKGGWTQSLREGLKSHADFAGSTSLLMQVLAAKSCPFLAEHRCSIWEQRPSICRVTASWGNPAGCHPHHIGDSSIIPRGKFVDGLYRQEAEVLAHHGLRPIRIPISAAVLLGAEVLNGLSLRDAFERAQLEVHL